VSSGELAVLSHLPVLGQHPCRHDVRLLVIPLTAVVGLAVDFGRAYSVKSQTQQALDAAALAGGRVSQVEKTDTVNKARRQQIGILQSGQANQTWVST